MIRHNADKHDTDAFKRFYDHQNWKTFTKDQHERQGTAEDDRSSLGRRPWQKRNHKGTVIKKIASIPGKNNRLQLLQCRQIPDTFDYQYLKENDDTEFQPQGSCKLRGNKNENNLNKWCKNQNNAIISRLTFEYLQQQKTINRRQHHCTHYLLYSIYKSSKKHFFFHPNIILRKQSTNYQEKSYFGLKWF